MTHSDIYLSINEVPTSFTAQAFLIGAESKFLNPKEDSSKMKLIRAIYSIAVIIFAAPCGVAYHLFSAVASKIDSIVSNDAMRTIIAWEHFKAAGYDLVDFIFFFIPVIRFTFGPEDAAELALQHTLIQDQPIGESDIQAWTPKYDRFPVRYKENLDNIRKGLFHLGVFQMCVSLGKQGKLKTTPLGYQYTTNNLGVDEPTYRAIRQKYYQIVCNPNYSFMI